MIFPAQLPKVTFYLPELDTYYELNIYASSMRFVAESFYTTEAISARKYNPLRGFRLEVDLSFDQFMSHSTMRNFWNDVYNEYQAGGDEIHLFLKAQSDIENDSDYLEVTVTQLLADFAYRNTIGRHGYNLSFTGKIALPEITEVDVVYVIVQNGDFVINTAGANIVVEAFGG